VNRRDNFPIGNGNVIMHGLALRTAEDEIKHFAYGNYFEYHIQKEKYDF
jgi:hypothetical protein